jgi:CO dehydrogenase/acetyl-CoA synthase beta subunit
MIDLTIINDDQEVNKIIETTKDVHREEDKIIIDLTDQGLDLIARQRVIKAICQMIHKRCKN